MNDHEFKWIVGEVLNGSSGGIRTPDQVINSHLLYHWATEEHGKVKEDSLTAQKLELYNKAFIGMLVKNELFTNYLHSF